MITPVLFLVALTLGQQTPAPVQTPTATGPAPAAASLPTVEVESDGRTRITEVCRTEPVTGSRFGRRVCRSPLQTDDERRDSQFMLRRMQGSRFPDGG